MKTNTKKTTIKKETPKVKLSNESNKLNRVKINNIQWPHKILLVNSIIHAGQLSIELRRLIEIFDAELESIGTKAIGEERYNYLHAMSHAIKDSIEIYLVEQKIKNGPHNHCFTNAEMPNPDKCPPAIPDELKPIDGGAMTFFIRNDTYSPAIAAILPLSRYIKKTLYDIGARQPGLISNRDNLAEVDLTDEPSDIAYDRFFNSDGRVFHVDCLKIVIDKSPFGIEQFNMPAFVFKPEREFGSYSSDRICPMMHYKGDQVQKMMVDISEHPIQIDRLTCMYFDVLPKTSLYVVVNGKWVILNKDIKKIKSVNEYAMKA